MPSTTTVPELSKKAEEQILAGLRTSHEKIVEAADAVVKPIERYVPKGPKLSLPKQLPTTQEAVDGAFGFTIKLVEAQRSFAADLLGTASPVLRKLTGHSPAATRSAAKARAAS
jgi:hypothetical protein